MFKFTVHTQKKLEEIFSDGGYTVRYEKGNFQSGYCVLESKRVVVINKFHDIEAKINALLEILLQVNLNLEGLSEESSKLFKKIKAEKEADLFHSPVLES